MLGAIAGDVIGSVHEHPATKSTDFHCLPMVAGLPTTRSWLWRSHCL